MAEKEAKVKIGVEGADDVGRAAKEALDPWENKARTLQERFANTGKSIASTLEDAFASVGRSFASVITASNRLDLATAVAGAERFDRTITRMATGAGRSLDAMTDRMQAIGDRTGLSDNAAAQWARSIAAVTYDLDGATKSAGALGDEALATGREFDEMNGLYVALQKAVPPGRDVGDVLKTIRAQAETLGTIGGPRAFEDQIRSLDGALSHLSSKADVGKFTALMGTLGKGLRPEQAQRVQQRVSGALESQAVDISRTVGYDILDEQGHVKDPTKVLGDLQKRMKKTGLSKQQQLYAWQRWLGPEAGTIMAHADLSQVPKVQAEAQAQRAKDDAEAHSRAAAYRRSPAGQREARAREAEREQQAMGAGLLGLRDKYDEQFRGHPILRSVADWGIDTAMSNKTAAAAVGAGLGVFGGAKIVANEYDAEQASKIRDKANEGMFGGGRNAGDGSGHGPSKPITTTSPDLVAAVHKLANRPIEITIVNHGKGPVGAVTDDGRQGKQ